jgi:nucleotide-binding universal stress UspA family protein
MLELSQQGAVDYLRAKIDGLRQQGLTAAAEVARGDATSAIVATAERIGADLIVLGTHGKAGMDAFWSGSITPKIANRTHLPLLLVPVTEQTS